MTMKRNDSLSTLFSFLFEILESTQLRCTSQFAGMSVLSVINIFNVSDNGWKGYKDYFDVILYFERIIEQNIHNRDYYCHGVVNDRNKENFIQKQMDYLIPLIKSHITQSKDPYVPQYIYDIFVHFCESKEDLIDLSCISEERRFMCKDLRMIFFSQDSKERRLNSDRIKDLFPKLQSYRDEHSLLVKVGQIVVNHKWYDDIEKTNAKINDDDDQIERDGDAPNLPIIRIDEIENDDDERKYPNELDTDQRSFEEQIMSQQVVSSRKLDIVLNAEDERKYPDEPRVNDANTKDFDLSPPKPAKRLGTVVAEEKDDNRHDEVPEAVVENEEAANSGDTEQKQEHIDKEKIPIFERIPKPDPGECWADQYPDKKDPRGEPDEISFKWDKNIKDKKQCDTVHMLYLLQLACDLHRRRVIERNKYFTSIARADRYIDHVDGPQIITNILKWHNEDREKNVLLGEWLSSKPELFMINEIISDIGMNMQNCEPSFVPYL